MRLEVLKVTVYKKPVRTRLAMPVLMELSHMAGCRFAPYRYRQIGCHRPTLALGYMHFINNDPTFPGQHLVPDFYGGPRKATFLCSLPAWWPSQLSAELQVLS